MCPYVITTTPTERGLAGTEIRYDERATRRAVATLDKARAAATEAVKQAHEAYGQSWDERWEGWAATDLYVDEPGGTIGPLPDGTVIEVEQVSYFNLRDTAGLKPGDAYAHMDAAQTRANVLDAFNAAQEH